MLRKYPELFEQIKCEGHHVGNHTMHHLKVLALALKLIAAMSWTMHSSTVAFSSALRTCETHQLKKFVKTIPL